ncbi:hypothetical protein OJ253_750 [Cryptosporidium canis]|uniref:Uncharacterized protein n=1 Tax=Cryptosporidium canis TaxID=195482 RepID=A0A9D5HY84_9CRYT|nr:hypothetical protein OJ253_750 [Cryptosporidium canis]
MPGPFSMGGMAGTGPDDQLLHKGSAVGVGNPKMGYMVNFPGYSNPTFVQAYPHMTTGGAEQPQQDIRGAVQHGVPNIGGPPEGRAPAPIPVLYPYPGGIARPIGTPSPSNPIGVFRPVPGAPNGGVIAPVVMVPGATAPARFATSPSSSPVLGPEPSTARPAQPNGKPSKRGDQGRRASRAAEGNGVGTRDGSEANRAVAAPNEPENGRGSPLIEGVNPVVGGIPPGGPPPMIHGLAPVYYGIPGLPEVQPINLQYIGGGMPHAGSHPPIFVHANPQIQCQRPVIPGICGAIPGNMDPGQPAGRPDSEALKGSGHPSPNMAPILPPGYYHNVHYIGGDDPLGVMGYNGFPGGGFAPNSMGPAPMVPDSGAAAPANTGTRAKNPAGGNGKSKSNRKNNGNSGGSKKNAQPKPAPEESSGYADPERPKNRGEAPATEPGKSDGSQSSSEDREKTAKDDSETAEKDQSQCSRKAPTGSSGQPGEEAPGKSQASGKGSKQQGNPGGKAKGGHKSGKKASNGKGNSEQGEPRSTQNNGKAKTNTNSGTDTDVNVGTCDRPRRSLKHSSISGNGSSDGYGKTGVSEGSNSRGKRATGNEKCPDEDLSGNNSHGNQTGSHKSKGNASKGSDQGDKGIGLDNFPLLSDAIANKK